MQQGEQKIQTYKHTKKQKKDIYMSKPKTNVSLYAKYVETDAD